MPPASGPPSSSKFDPVAGRVVLGRYRIIGALGRGGTGVVYLGRTEGAAGFSRPVVIKQLLPNLVSDPQHVRMLVREARILANLKHAGIVGVVDLGEEDGAYVMVLDYVHGYDLGHWLKFLRQNELRLPMDVALEISIRVLEALHYAHSLTKPDGSPGGVIHRDVSPSNILIDVDGNIRILDFGIAHVTDELADPDTKKNLFKGKVGYSHPILLKLGTPSAATDTYSAAVVTLQMLIGFNPFYAESTAATVDRVLNKPLPKLRDFLPDASAGLEQILLAALSREGGYASAQDLAEALKSERTVSPSDASALLVDLARRDFNGEMPTLLQLQPLARRDAAWRSFSAVHSEGLQRMSRFPRPAEPTVVDRPPAGVNREEATTLAGQGSLAASSGHDRSGGHRQTRRAFGIPDYRWLLASLSVALLTSSALLLMRSNPPSGAHPPSDARDAAALVVLATAEAAVAETVNEPTLPYLSRVFAQRQSQVQQCFSGAALDDAPELVEIRFQVDGSGTVTGASVSPVEWARGALETCLIAVARQTAFGPLTRGATFRIPVRVSVRTAEQ
jgi:eukaryotic-like serine/threonine-protein kinase